MRTYLVGGAVRDRLLGRAVHERDWVVTGATPETLLALGYRAKDPAIPVFTHPDTGEEYALARRERKHGHGHKGFLFDCGPDVTLEEDLARRDLTINAMAQDSEGRLVDPWRGRRDLETRRLRHVTPAFVEDPLRVLRLARFASQLATFDFEIAPETARLAVQMSLSDELITLSAGRLWREFSKALSAEQPEIFLRCLARFGALPRVMPWLEPPRGDDGERVAGALAQAARLSADPTLRLATAMAAAGRLGAIGVAPDDWPLPGEARVLSKLCLEHPLPSTADADAVLDWLEVTDAWRRAERFDRLLLLWGYVDAAREADLARLRLARDASRKVPPPRALADPRAAVRTARLERVRNALGRRGENGP